MGSIANDPTCAEEEDDITGDTDRRIEHPRFGEDIQTTPKDACRAEDRLADRHQDHVCDQDQKGEAFQRKIRRELKILEVIFDVFPDFHKKLLFLNTTD